MNFALPVHEGVAVAADLEALNLSENLTREAVLEEAGRTERTGTTEVIIVVGAGWRILERDNTDLFWKSVGTLDC